MLVLFMNSQVEMMLQFSDEAAAWAARAGEFGLERLNSGVRVHCDRSVKSRSTGGEGHATE